MRRSVSKLGTLSYQAREPSFPYSVHKCGGFWLPRNEIYPTYMSFASKAFATPGRPIVYWFGPSNWIPYLPKCSLLPYTWNLIVWKQGVSKMWTKQDIVGEETRNIIAMKESHFVENTSFGIFKEHWLKILEKYVYHRAHLFLIGI